MENSSVICIKYDKKILSDLTKTFRTLGQGETHLGEQFSPSAGFLFQINVFNADSDDFYVFLKNCGKESVKILQFKVVPQYTYKSPETISAEKTNFSLPPGVSVAVPAISFQNTVGRFQGKLLTLTFCLEIEATVPVLVQRYFCADLQPAIPTACTSGSCLEEDLKRERDDPAFADGLLLCQGQEIPCHKVLLAARSDVFKKMFLQTEFVEGQSGRVEIKDLDVATVNAMLSYVYTDNFDTQDVDIVVLFSAADQFNIPGLRAKCETILIEDLSTANVVDYFHRAFLHGAARLKMVAMVFIAKNFEEVLATPEWIDFKGGANCVAALEEILAFLTCRMWK